MTNPPAYPDALPRNYRLRNYRLLKVLGKGFFAFTYLAIDESLPMLFVIKEYFPNVAVRMPEMKLAAKSDLDIEEYKTGLSRFLNDATIFSKLPHENIVPIHTFFEENNGAYLVMPYQNGENLSNALMRNPTLSEQSLIDMVFSILNGLDQLHANNYIYQHIQLSSIFLPKSLGQTLAKIGSSYQIFELNKTTAFLLSSGDSPLEPFGPNAKAALGPWTDIYAIGAVLYRCVTGQLPTKIHDRSKMILANAGDPMMPAIKAGNKNYSERFLYAIDAALAVRIKNRPQTTQAFREMLLPPLVDHIMANWNPSGLNESQPPDHPQEKHSEDNNKNKHGIWDVVKTSIIGMVGLFGRKNNEIKSMSERVAKLSKDVDKAETSQDINEIKKKLSADIHVFQESCQEMQNHYLSNEQELKSVMVDVYNKRKQANQNEKVDTYIQNKNTAATQEPCKPESSNNDNRKDVTIKHEGWLDEPSLSPAKLICLDETMPETIKEIILDQAIITIGNGSENTVSVSSNKLSPLNARIYHKDRMWYIEDYQGSFGVKINNTKIQNSPLKDDDVLFIGYIKFQFKTKFDEKSEASQNELVDKIKKEFTSIATTNYNFIVVKLQILNIDQVISAVSQKEGKKVNDFIEERLKNHFVGTSNLLYKSSSGIYFVLYHGINLEAVANAFDKLLGKIKIKVIPGRVGTKAIIVEGKYNAVDSKQYTKADDIIEILGIHHETIGLPLV